MCFHHPSGERLMVQPPLNSSKIKAMWVWSLVLILLQPLIDCFQTSSFLDTVSCSQGLGCKLREADVLCIPGEIMPDPTIGAILVLTHMETRNKLRCQKQQDCIPCVQVVLHLGLLEPSELEKKQVERAPETNIQAKHHHVNTGEFLKAHILLSTWTYPSKCVVVEVSLLHGHDLHNSTLGFLHFDCFPVAIGGELYIRAFTIPHYLSAGLLQLTHSGPDCNWHKAQDAVHLCQVPKLEVSMGSEEAVFHVSDVPEGQHYYLQFYLNQTNTLEDMNQGTVRLITGPENMSIPVSQVLSCLCLQVWPKVEDQEDLPRTHLCPFASNAETLTRAWTLSRLDMKAHEETVSCSISPPCDLSGVLVPCWKGELNACHPLHPQLHMALIPHEPQEFLGLRPHPNLCVQVISNGSTYLQRCLHEGSSGGNQTTGQHLLLWKTFSSQGKSSACVLEEGNWVPTTQASSTRSEALREALEQDIASGGCFLLWKSKDNETNMLWVCPLEKYRRTHWVPVCVVTLFGLSSILLLLLLKKEAMKGWLRILKEDYTSEGLLQGQHVLILYSADHRDYEHLVGTLAGALTQLNLSVSLELWSRGEMGSLGPMQWLHAQRHHVLHKGGTVVLLFSPGAIAGCSQWLGLEQKASPTFPVNLDNTFLASLNCALPDFLAGKAKNKYIVACFEELLPVDQIPGLFRSVPVFSLSTQLFSFLLALAGPSGISYKQRCSLKRHAVWISKTLERRVCECQQKQARPQPNAPLLPPKPVLTQREGPGYQLAVS